SLRAGTPWKQPGKRLCPCSKPGKKYPTKRSRIMRQAVKGRRPLTAFSKPTDASGGRYDHRSPNGNRFRIGAQRTRKNNVERDDDELHRVDRKPRTPSVDSRCGGQTDRKASVAHDRSRSM